MAGSASWSYWSFHLSQLNIDEFKQQITPFLRLFNSSFERANFRGGDFIVLSENEPLPFVVKCHVFENPILQTEQAVQVINSINEFFNSGIECETYYVIHNQQHGFAGKKFEEFILAVNESLQRLKFFNKAKEAKLLQRQDFLQEAEKKLKSILNKKLREYSERYKADLQAKLPLSKYYIASVPVAEHELLFRDCDIPEFEEVNKHNNHKIHEVLASTAKSVRWTLLHGKAGAGKTTVALSASTSQEKVNFFVRCDILDFESLQSGTNNLLEQIMKSMKLLDDEFEEADLETIYDLAGASLSSMLENSDVYTLLFDGLDENRFYSNPKAKGLKLLSDKLTNFHCQIILITRTSHFEAFLKDFDDAFTSKNPRVRKKARVLELHNWYKDNILEFINKIIADDEEWNISQCERIRDFQKLVKSDDYKKLYGELPLNPLFLNFIIEDVIYEGLRLSTRPSLIYHWIRRKITRDIKVTYRSFIVNKDSDDFNIDKAVDKILYLMESIAKKMLEETEYGYELKEFIKTEVVEEEAKQIFNVDSASIIDILLNSVLISQTQLSRKKYRASKDKITFSFRIFQEYFLACFLFQEEGKVDAYPETVRTLHAEIKSNIEKEPDTDFAIYFLNKVLDLSNNFSRSDYAGESKFLPGETATIETSPTSTVLTAGQRQRLQVTLDRLQGEWDLRSQKIKDMRIACAIETSITVKFQLKQELLNEEANLAHLSNELEQIELRLQQ
ncbi:hypothetical protein H6G91_23690 [Nostoc muscorum FACHB-395]|nr:hypothetical protein [Desmonostoc muscorum FACHB-395]